MLGAITLSLLLSSPASAEDVITDAVPVSMSSSRTKKPLLAAGLNFFIPGAGYLYNGEKPLYVSLPMIAGAVGLTYVEQVHQFDNGNLLEQDPTAFAVMFGAVLALNTGAAIDAFREAKAINAGGVASLSVQPQVAWTGGEATYGLNADVRF